MTDLPIPHRHRDLPEGVELPPGLSEGKAARAAVLIAEWEDSDRPAFDLAVALWLLYFDAE